MTEQREGECLAVYHRRTVTEGIIRACDPKFELDPKFEATADGSEEALLRWASVLVGIVDEYQDGGDQMVETCDCGGHQ